MAAQPFKDCTFISNFGGRESMHENAFVYISTIQVFKADRVYIFLPIF